jgi:hypothetical protein
MAASASNGAVEVAAVLSDAMAYKIRKELVSGKFKSGREIDAATLESKRSQYTAWEAARGGVTRAAKWSRQLTDIAKNVGETQKVATEARDAAVSARDILQGKEVPRSAGQTDAERVKELRLKIRLNHNEIGDLKEKEDARKRRPPIDETPAEKAAREEKDAARDVKVKDAADAKAATKTAKDEEKKAKAETKKAEAAVKKTAANLKRANAAEAKAGKSGLAGPSKRQKSDGLQQIDVKQTTLSFPAPAGSQVPESEERAENLTGPLMLQLGVPCPEVVKNGTCGRMDVCYHRKKARDEDEQEVHNQLQANYKESLNKATRESVAYEATKANAGSAEVPCASILLVRSVGMRGGVRVCMCSRAGTGCFGLCLLGGCGLGHPPRVSCA